LPLTIRELPWILALEIWVFGGGAEPLVAPDVPEHETKPIESIARNKRILMAFPLLVGNQPDPFRYLYRTWKNF
jgi:hypothetical protein